MSESDFDQPVSGLWFKPADTHGHLILVTTVHGIDKHFDSLKDGEVDRAEFDYVDLDDPEQALIDHVYDTHPGIVKKLVTAGRTGRAVLGVIDQAPTNKGNPAWILGPYDETADHAKRASAWLDARKTGRFTQPATPASPPVAAPVVSGTRAPAPAAPAAPVATGGQEYTVNGTKVDREQYEKLVSLGLVPALNQ